MRTDRRWARFYFDDFIRDYPDIYADDRAFATWMRLLVLAERAWPAVPELPRSAQVKVVHRLRDRGLVAIGPDFTFAIKGFNVERERRHAVALVAANASANARANAPASVEPSTRTSTSTRTERLNRDSDTPSRERSPRGEPTEGAA